MKAEAFIITSDTVDQLAEILIHRMKEEMMIPSSDPYLPPKQLAEMVPALSESGIRSQIRRGAYGKRIGPKGKLVAKKSQVIKFNRL